MDARGWPRTCRARCSAPGPARARRAAAGAACAISARPIATICCWPPDSAPAGCASFSTSAGNSAHTRSSERARSRRAAPQVAADLQVLAHRHLGEQAPALGHQRDALAAEAMRRQPRDVLAVEHAAARRCMRCSPAIALISVLLPALLGPTTHSSSPSPIVERHVPQRGRLRRRRRGSTAAQAWAGSATPAARRSSALGARRRHRLARGRPRPPRAAASPRAARLRPAPRRG